MLSFFKTFYGKLSTLFLILLLLMGTIQALLTTRSWSAYSDKANQALNLHLATDIAAELKPLLADSLDMHLIEHSIHYMMVLNPKIEIYLLDATGKILAFFADPPGKIKADYVDLEPVKMYIDEQEKIPILGEDPRKPGTRKAFSAAPLRIGRETNGYLYIILSSEQFTTATRHLHDHYLTNTFVRSLVLALLFTGIIGLVLFAFLTRRIRQMREAVIAFENGNYNRRLKDHRQDELAQLAQSFDKMADTLVDNIEMLRHTDRQRRELIANISHDLRSPLASIRGYLETIQMKDEKLTSIERHKFMNVLLDSTVNLERMVEELFELSKLDAKQVHPRPEPFSIKDLIYDVIMKYKPVADPKQIELNACVPDGIPQVFADIGLIERVLSNLLENAITYTPEKGSVTITASSNNSKIRLMISDTGFGIDKKDLPHIFERFYRADKSRSKDHGGSGLGLAIAKKIIEIHQGSLSVQSEINVGSTFSFDLDVWQK